MGLTRKSAKEARQLAAEILSRLDAILKMTGGPELSNAYKNAKSEVNSFYSVIFSFGFYLLLLLSSTSCDKVFCPYLLATYLEPTFSSSISHPMNPIQSNSTGGEECGVSGGQGGYAYQAQRHLRNHQGKKNIH